ncbi:MAG: DUF2157 domain-containing protein [Acidimicrobiia bacterium]|jgi:uncharacterized membrane protein
MGREEDLRRWVAAGLIDDRTAGAIESFESARTGTGRVGRGMEAVAYLGAVLILVALGLLATEFWEEMAPWGRLVLGAAVTLILVVVGLILGRSDEPAVERAQTFAWLLAVAAVALTVAVALTEYTDIEGQETFLYTSLASLVTAVTLWWLRSSVLQMAAMGVATGAATVAVVSRFESAPDWVFGLAFAGVGLVWLALTWAGVFRPVKTSYALSAIGILSISFPEGNELPWPVLGLAAALALMGLSVRLGENVLLGLGVVGLFIYIPMTIFELFGESLGVPVALLITGLVLLGVVVATVRLRQASIRAEDE